MSHNNDSPSDEAQRAAEGSMEFTRAGMDALADLQQSFNVMNARFNGFQTRLNEFSRQPQIRKSRTSALSADFRDFRASVRQKSADFLPPVEEVRATEVSGRTANGRCPGHARLGRRRAPVRTPSGGRGRRTQLRENRRTSGGLPGLRHIAIQDLELQGHAGSPRLMESETTESWVSYHVIVSLRES
ncbi:hypothetical protein CF326_g4149 [Tilletia indica]|nr:hypothetical protein CF326_g4149 [Tilletia indica]